MSVPRFKRKASGLEYVDNAYELQKQIMIICSKLSNRTIDRQCCIQADLTNMVASMKPVRYEDYIVRRTLLRIG